MYMKKDFNMKSFNESEAEILRLIQMGGADLGNIKYSID